MAIISKTSNLLKFVYTLRVRLLIIFVSIGIVPLTIFIYMLITSYDRTSLSQKVTQLEKQCNIVANQLAYSWSRVQSQENVMTSEIGQLLSDMDGRIIIADYDFKVIKDTNNLIDGKYLFSENVMKVARLGEVGIITDKKNMYLEIAMNIERTQEQDRLGVMVLTTTIDDVMLSVAEIQRKAVILTIAIGMLIIVSAYFFAIVLTKPLRKMSDSIDKIAEGYMDEELNIKGYTEIQNITDAFNKMTSKLQALEDSRQEFVSNVSHELKTPITSMKVLADSLLMQENVPEELYKEFMVDITEEIERENKIINDLLSLVKMDKTSVNLNIAPVNMNELMELILKRLRPIASKKNIELVFESFRPVVVEIDEVKMTLAISNLIENAIKYNIDDGWVRVSLNADHKFMFIKVSDSGIGIPEEAQENIFDRFYRVDKARSRESGGTGLGLAITRNAIIMHKGAIKVYSKEDEGTTFTARVPLTYVP